MYFVLSIVYDLLIQQNTQNCPCLILETILLLHVLFLGLPGSLVIHITHFVPRAIMNRVLLPRTLVQK